MVEPSARLRAALWARAGARGWETHKRCGGVGRPMTHSGKVPIKFIVCIDSFRVLDTFTILPIRFVVVFVRLFFNIFDSRSPLPLPLKADMLHRLGSHSRSFDGRK